MTERKDKLELRILVDWQEHNIWIEIDNFKWLPRDTIKSLFWKLAEGVINKLNNK